MTKILIPLAFLCAIFSACSSDTSTVNPPNTVFADGRSSAQEQFFSDSLNAMGLYRTYPVPNVVYTPVPRGYKPVYISSYARHGSRKLIGTGYVDRTLSVLEGAAELNCLTSLGQDVLDKIKIMGDDLQISDADLTTAGVEQHKGIAERMYRNYRNIFSHKNTPVRLYSTVTQRTIMSMLSENARLLELNPNVVSTRSASNSLTFLTHAPIPEKAYVLGDVMRVFLKEHFDARPMLSRLFTEGMPALKDTVSFVSGLYSCGSITCGLDLENVDFIWDLFTYDELYIIQQASNYSWYVFNSNSSQLGDYILASICGLLRDFIDRADVALAEDIPGADLRFGHDSSLTPFTTLIGLGGFVPKEDDDLAVFDIFQTFNAAPMAGNVQMVFYRNRAGDVIVKLLQNEVESFVPIDTDIYPYYHWDDLRAYFESRIDLYSKEL